ncbi:MAG: N-acetyltransferase [Burkholderiaceae bacterium]|nr:N-acetyltransferase [Burkholderiaceae bacterium]
MPAERWDALLARQATPTPFMHHAYLAALHESGSAVAETGWTPRFVELQRGGVTVGACALYLKHHSYGEYVFDWAWADAYRRHGLAYYPKLLAAVPFTPVPGSRLLAVDDAARAALAHGLVQLAQESGVSSLHLLYPDEADRAALAAAGWLMREGVQFHWTQDAADPAPDFATLLARLQRDKRKKIQQERRRVAEAGVVFEVHEGAAIDEALWDFFHRCYVQTYAEHHSSPYLTRDFFARMAATMPQHWVMFVATREGRRIAASLVAVDADRGAAWGRYWGALEHVPCLHFEACYYQPLAWCLTHGYRRFEGGAQGEHKMARGLMPVRTHSAHWLAHPRFADAVADFLDQERAGVADYVGELQARSPFKAGA